MNILYSAPTTVVKSHIIEVANNFAELGHKVHLVTFWKNKPEINPDISWYNASVRNRHLSELLNEYVIKLSKSYIKNFFKLYNKEGKGSLFKVVLSNIIDDNKIDFIYERYNSGSPTSKIGKNKHIPVILELNGIWPFDAKDKGFSESFCNEQLKLDLEALSLATTVRVVGTGIRDYYVKHGIDEKKIHIIGNGANTEHFRPMNRDACRERLGIAKNKKIIGFSGSFQFYVGLEHIIRAMPLVLEKVPDAHLFLMGRRLPKGSGVSDKDIMDLVTELDLQNNITVFPDCLYADMPYYINAFDVCLVPLTSERNEFSGCSPLKFHEYLACGKPVVASMIERIQDYKEVGKEDIVSFCQPENSVDLSEKIIYLLKNEDKANEMGQRGRRYVLEYKSWKKITKKIISVIDRDTHLCDLGKIYD